MSCGLTHSPLSETWNQASHWHRLHQHVFSFMLFSACDFKSYACFQIQLCGFLSWYFCFYCSETLNPLRGYCYHLRRNITLRYWLSVKVVLGNMSPGWGMEWCLLIINASDRWLVKTSAGQCDRPHVQTEANKALQITSYVSMFGHQTVTSVPAEDGPQTPDLIREKTPPRSCWILNNRKLLQERLCKGAPDFNREGFPFVTCVSDIVI